MTPKSTNSKTSGRCPDSSKSSKPKQSLRGIAPPRVDLTSLCSGCQSQPIGGGCLRHPCSNCKRDGVPRGLKLCKSCSNKLGQCRRCRQPLPADAESHQEPVELLTLKSGPVPAAGGTTCGSCLEVPLPTNAAAGRCAECRGFTASRAIKLCAGCSGNVNQCDRCRKRLTGSSSSKARRTPRPRR